LNRLFVRNGSLLPLRHRKHATDLGEVDIVSAGAIAQAAMYALLRLPSVPDDKAACSTMM